MRPEGFVSRPSSVWAVISLHPRRFDVGQSPCVSNQDILASDTHTDVSLAVPFLYKPSTKTRYEEGRPYARRPPSLTLAAGLCCPGVSPLLDDGNHRPRQEVFFYFLFLL